MVLRAAGEGEAAPAMAASPGPASWTFVLQTLVRPRIAISSRRAGPTYHLHSSTVRPDLHRPVSARRSEPAEAGAARVRPPTGLVRRPVPAPALLLPSRGVSPHAATARGPDPVARTPRPDPLRRAPRPDATGPLVHRRAAAAEEPAEAAPRRFRRFRRVEDPALARGARVVGPRPAVIPAAISARPSPVAPQMPAQAPALRQPAAAWPAPPVNVDALAAQVVRQIDRRVTAWRERTGRV